MDKFVNKVYQKAEEVLFYDKLKMPTEVSKLVSNEMYHLLTQFFDVKKNSFKSSILVEKDGELNIYFSFRANRVLMKRQSFQE